MPTPVPHGDIDYGELARLGLTPHDIIDFSANSNPFGPHLAVLEAIRENEDRARMLGYDVFAHKLAAVMLSGTMSAAAGAAVHSAPASAVAPISLSANMIRVS